jgi:hypothetical protein
VFKLMTLEESITKSTIPTSLAGTKLKKLLVI